MLVCLWLATFTFVSVVIRYCPKRCGCCGLFEKLRSRWFWFFFGAQMCFLVREFLIISLFGRWNLFLSCAHVSMIFVVFGILTELWQLSYLRKYSPASMDQILDMVLLPLNYGVLMCHTVRILGRREGTQGTYDQLVGSNNGNDLTKARLIVANHAVAGNGGMLGSTIGNTSGMFGTVESVTAHHLVHPDSSLSSNITAIGSMLMGHSSSLNLGEIDHLGINSLPQYNGYLSYNFAEYDSQSGAFNPFTQYHRGVWGSNYDGNYDHNGEQSHDYGVDMAVVWIILQNRFEFLKATAGGWVPAPVSAIFNTIGDHLSEVLNAIENIGSQLFNTIQTGSIGLPTPVDVPIPPVVEPNRAANTKGVDQVLLGETHGITQEPVNDDREDSLDDLDWIDYLLDAGNYYSIFGEVPYSPESPINGIPSGDPAIAQGGTQGAEEMQSDSPSGILGAPEQMGPESRQGYYLKDPQSRHLRNAARLAIADTTIQTADIWEAWALWSVLKMFTTVVDQVSKSQTNIRNDSKATTEDSGKYSPASIRKNNSDGLSDLREPLLDIEGSRPLVQFDASITSLQASPKQAAYGYRPTVQRIRTLTLTDRAVTSFQRFCLAVLQVYVLTSLLTNILEVVVKGILGVHFPTLCPFLLQSCKYTCVSWWDTYIGPYIALIISLLCTAAIYCVFVFEGAFHGELKSLSPYWKFLGVKGVVSVTWTQWLVIRYVIFGFEYQWLAYYFYAVLCVVELPALVLIHKFFAYPVNNVYIECSADEHRPRRHHGGDATATDVEHHGDGDPGNSVASGMANDAFVSQNLSRKNQIGSKPTLCPFPEDAGLPMYPPALMEKFLSAGAQDENDLNYHGYSSQGNVPSVEQRTATSRQQNMTGSSRVEITGSRTQSGTDLIVGGHTRNSPGDRTDDEQFAPLREYLYRTVVQAPDKSEDAFQRRVVFATDEWIRYLIEHSVTKYKSPKTARGRRGADYTDFTMKVRTGRKNTEILTLGANPPFRSRKTGLNDSKGPVDQYGSYDSLYHGGGPHQAAALGGMHQSDSKTLLQAPSKRFIEREVPVESIWQRCFQSIFCCYRIFPSAPQENPSLPGSPVSSKTRPSKTDSKRNESRVSKYVVIPEEDEEKRDGSSAGSMVSLSSHQAHALLPKLLNDEDVTENDLENLKQLKSFEETSMSGESSDERPKSVTLSAQKNTSEVDPGMPKTTSIEFGVRKTTTIESELGGVVQEDMAHPKGETDLKDAYKTAMLAAAVDGKDVTGLLSGASRDREDQVRDGQRTPEFYAEKAEVGHATKVRQSYDDDLESLDSVAIRGLDPSLLIQSLNQEIPEYDLNATPVFTETDMFSWCPDWICGRWLRALAFCCCAKRGCVRTTWRSIRYLLCCKCCCQRGFAKREIGEPDNAEETDDCLFPRCLCPCCRRKRAEPEPEVIISRKASEQSDKDDDASEGKQKDSAATAALNKKSNDNSAIGIVTEGASKKQPKKTGSKTGSEESDKAAMPVSKKITPPQPDRKPSKPTTTCPTPHFSRASRRRLRYIRKFLKQFSLTSLSSVAVLTFLVWSLNPENREDVAETNWKSVKCSRRFPTIPNARFLTFPDSTICRSTYLSCNIGYRGMPEVHCEADLGYDVKGTCEMIGCGAPPELPNADPTYKSGALNEKQTITFSSSRKFFWKHGEVVHYDCKPGYRGGIIATCKVDGSYDIDGTCSIVGCGVHPPAIPFAYLPETDDVVTTTAPKKDDQLQATLRKDVEQPPGMEAGAVSGTKPGMPPGESPAWMMSSSMSRPAVLHRNSTGLVTLDKSYAGERLQFQCNPGYRGKPVAECRNDGDWLVTDSCVPYSSVLGCTCKSKWISCDNWIQGTNCYENSGCSLTPDYSYSWCELESTTCPNDASVRIGITDVASFSWYPSWDYCVTTTAPVKSYERKPVPAQGFSWSRSIGYALAYESFWSDVWNLILSFVMIVFSIYKIATLSETVSPEVVQLSHDQGDFSGSMTLRRRSTSQPNSPPTGGQARQFSSTAQLLAHGTSAPKLSPSIPDSSPVGSSNVGTPKMTRTDSGNNAANNGGNRTPEDPPAKQSVFELVKSTFNAVFADTPSMVENSPGKDSDDMKIDSPLRLHEPLTGDEGVGRTDYTKPGLPKSTFYSSGTSEDQGPDTPRETPREVVFNPPHPDRNVIVSSSGENLMERALLMQKEDPSRIEAVGPVGVPLQESPPNANSPSANSKLQIDSPQIKSPGGSPDQRDRSSDGFDRSPHRIESPEPVPYSPPRLSGTLDESSMQQQPDEGSIEQTSQQRESAAEYANTVSMEQLNRSPTIPLDQNEIQFEKSNESPQQAILPPRDSAALSAYSLQEAHNSLSAAQLPKAESDGSPLGPSRVEPQEEVSPTLDPSVCREINSELRAEVLAAVAHGTADTHKGAIDNADNNNPSSSSSVQLLNPDSVREFARTSDGEEQAKEEAD